jgi:hypothetical protein
MEGDMFDGRWYYTSSGWTKAGDRNRPRSIELKKALEILTDGMKADHRYPVLVYAARYLLVEYDRRELPDWVETLASIDPDKWWDDEVIELRGEITDMLLAEEGGDKNDHDR